MQRRPSAQSHFFATACQRFDHGIDKGRSAAGQPRHRVDLFVIDFQHEANGPEHHSNFLPILICRARAAGKRARRPSDRARCVCEHTHDSRGRPLLHLRDANAGRERYDEFVRDRVAEFAQNRQHHLRFHTEENNFRFRSDFIVLCR